MRKKVKNPELIQKLFYGLPDSRICKVAKKVTVISDKGTRIVLKDRGFEKDEPIFLYKPIAYADLDSVIVGLEHKEVVVTSAVYNNAEIRNILKKI